MVFIMLLALISAKVSEKSSRLISTAVWLLQCIIHCEREKTGASIDGIIAFGDYINHAIMEYAEFSMAFHHLYAAKMVYLQGRTLRTTQSFQKWYRENVPQGKRPAYDKEAKKLTAYLEQKISKPVSRKITISETQFNAAIRRYQESWKDKL